MLPEALNAVDASIEASRIALDRRERLPAMFDRIAAFSLKSQICFEAADQSAAAEAKTAAKAMLDHIDRVQVTAEGLDRRYTEVSDLIAKSGVDFLGR
jgi:hypothetical protein